ncbi:MAG: hypothetical protein PHZ24_06155 [Bacteroidales bacterium]|nr:hypothetical protein [Bacteroidales bacterium]MDY0140576.1 hypothetical protein [Bacteroidales bacterium]
MKKNLIYISTIIVLAVLIFFVVRYFVKNRNPLNVDVSDIELNLEIERFDLDLIDANNSWKAIESLQEKYGVFFEIYNKEIISIGGIENSSYLTYLSTFLNDYSVVEAHREVNRTYSDCSKLDIELTQGFKHLLFYYPDENIPRIVSFIAGFNHSVVLIDGFIAIGLDKYLGKECQLYDMLGIPQYAKDEMVPEQIPIDVFTAWAQDRYLYKSESDNLLSYMVYNGKILYFLDAMFPDFNQARKLKYTEEQLAYCCKFERDIWTNIIENKLLFDTDYFTIRKFVENAPNTYQFGPDSPPRIANWVGLQIVRNYIKNNNITLIELMEENDYQKILNSSQYNPKYK